eukprot:Pgem_evm1s19740
MKNLTYSVAFIPVTILSIFIFDVWPQFTFYIGASFVLLSSIIYIFPCDSNFFQNHCACLTTLFRSCCYSNNDKMGYAFGNSELKYQKVNMYDIEDSSDDEHSFTHYDHHDDGREDDDIDSEDGEIL